MSTRPGPKVVIELVIVSVVFIAALLFIYQGIAMVMYGSGPRNAAASTPGGAVQGETSPDSAVGLRFQLSEGAPRPDAEEAPPPRTRPLDESQVTRLLASLPPLPAEADVARAVALTDEIPPPPLTGTTVQGEFPPPEDVAPAEEPAAGPLEVLRFGPEGEVERARDLSITFNQPMVPVTSHQELAARNVPARLWPATQGRWRWVGTRTLLFEVDAGFPMATRYQVSVPAGVRSAVGTQLTGDVSWSFETPPPALTDYYPLGRGPYERQPVIFLEFNQRIDPAAVLEHLQLRGPLRSRPEVRRASAAEIEADEAVKRRVQGAREGRWLAVRPSQPLPGGSNITVVVGEGTPSAEGPLTTRESQEFEFTTYGPLKVTEYDCGYGACTPGAPLRVEFSNPLDAESVDPSWVTVEPELANLRVSASHTSLMITGRTQPRTTYRVTLSAGIRDVFGQTLGEAARATMDIDSYPKALSARGGNLVVLDPDSPRQLIVKSVNHAQLDVRLYRVVPEDWSNFRERRRRRDEESYQPPGQLAHSARITVDAGQDEIAETRIDLGPALAVGLGQVIVVVEPTEQPEERWQRQEIITWVQATRIGLSAIQDADELIAWVTALDGAAPIAGAELSFLGDRRRQSTNAEGLATLTLPAGGGGRERVLVARRGDDVAFLPAGGWRVSAPHDRLAWYVFTDRPLYRPGEDVHFKGWVREIEGGPAGDVALLEDRGVRVAWTAVDSRNNDVAKGTTTLNDLFGFDGVLQLPEDAALGQVRLRFVAEGVRGVAAGAYDHAFQVQEYRRPEYEVSVTHDGGPHFVGGAALITAKATYFAGGGLAESDVDWRVTSATAFFRPPGWDEFAFGTSPRWPWGYDADEEENVQELEGRTDSEGAHYLRVELLEARPPVATTLQAAATIQDVNRQTWTESTNVLVHPAKVYVGLRSERRFVRAGEPLVIEAIAVTPEGEAVAGRPITLRAARTQWSWLRGAWREEELDAQECSVTSEPRAVRCEFETRRGGAYRVTATIEDEAGRKSLTELNVWATGGGGRWRRGEPIELVADRDEYQPGDTAEILVPSPFAAAEGIMTVRREGVAETRRFRADGPSHVLRVPILEEHTPNLHVSVELIAATGTDAAPGALAPDPDRVASGELNLQIPPRSRTLSLSAVPRARELKPGGETIVDLELRDAAGQPVANGDVALAVVDEAVLALLPVELQNPVEAFHPQRDDGATEQRSRDLLLLGPRVDATATEPGAVRGAIRDGESGGVLSGARVYLEGTEHNVLSGADGSYVLDRVAAGAYTLMVELIGYGDAEERIAVEPGGSQEMDFVLSGQDQYYLTRGMRLEELELAAPMAAMAEGDAARGGAGEAPAIRLRADFAALAVFVASARTDGRGRAQVPVRVPDNLTRYRVIAVAAADARQFGKGESTITAALPLMARPSPPRFLNFGDQLELPVVVQNRSASAVSVDVAVRAANLRFTGARGLRVEVPGEGRVEVRFPATTVQPGAVYVQVAAAAGSEADAAQVALPVWTPATTEAFATYGELDQGAASIPVMAPGDVIAEYGGLEVTTSSTALQALTDALLYLNAYPYECAEQLASRILAVAALRDVLTAFEAEGLPEPEAMVAAVDRDIKRLGSMQNYDGGFSFWGDPDEESWPYVSIHVAHALTRARQKDFVVPDELLVDVMGYLREIERHIPSLYPKDVRRTLQAYSLYVRMLMNDGDPAAARRIIGDGGLDSLPLEAAGWLLSVMSGQAAYADDVAAIRRYLGNRVSETAATAQFATGYGDGDYLVLYSSRRADAVILDALIADQPQSDLIPKLVRGLLGHRQRGHWLNTQENAFVLLALDRYFNRYESATPDFAARVWLGDDYAGGHEFRGRTTERHEIEVPMSMLVQRGGGENLVVGKDGPGRLYYRIGMRYAPADLQLDAAEHGFSVERTYQAVDDPDDVSREEDGTWVIRAGARVRVKLSLAAPARRYHVALVDPLPAGLEALNPELAGQQMAVDEDDEEPGPAGFGRRGWWPWWRWHEHQNLRDERVEVFTSLLWPGVYSYTYLARATTPGEFVVPPPKAEEMYFPETFGRGPSDRVVVRE